mgnify:CR=1 FL=1
MLQFFQVMKVCVCCEKGTWGCFGGRFDKEWRFGFTLRFGRGIGCDWVVAFAEKGLLSEVVFYGDLRIVIDEIGSFCKCVCCSLLMVVE